MASESVAHEAVLTQSPFGLEELLSNIVSESLVYSTEFILAKWEGIGMFGNGSPFHAKRDWSHEQ